MSHAPVLLREAVAALAPKAGDLIVDATFGGGGYTRALLEAADCKVIARDRDPDAIARGQALARLTPGRVEPREGRFGDLDTLVPEPVDGVALDLGVSSFQLDEPERGFSFRFDAPLDMRMAKAGPSAADVVAQFPEEALADAIWALGEETASRRIARALVEARREAPVATTAQLADLVEKALGGRKGARTHPATKTFQALRMLVNDELGELARALAGAETRLKPEGRLVVVSFHSLEDRIVKSFMVERAGAGGGGSRYAPERPAGRPPSFRLAQKKSIAPNERELAANPRARSAKLRVAFRTEAPAWGPIDDRMLAPKAAEAWERLT
ncbi:MAG: 16S rRNA (cytosine(1402)-N(4))-methyltransferase RsmH [Alphaproteobacteria bacterium]|nr:16S rRNA (cytosine(1402)-N(4))-methyltransferase RsmH [Alphaproteobacteria bacterium]